MWRRSWTVASGVSRQPRERPEPSSSSAVPRFTGTAAARTVLAKTGSLRYVSSLSGHVTTAAKERLVFSFMLNAYTGTTVSGREVIDELAVLLANFSGKSDGP